MYKRCNEAHFAHACYESNILPVPKVGVFHVDKLATTFYHGYSVGINGSAF